MTQLLNKKALLAKVPYSDRYILKLEGLGQFPKRIVLSPRRVAWDEQEIDAWIETRRASNCVADRPMPAR